MKPLFMPLTTHWFNKFANGTKTTELRIYGPRWNEKTCTVNPYPQLCQTSIRDHWLWQLGWQMGAAS